MVIVAIVIIVVVGALFFGVLSLSGLADSTASDLYARPKK